MPPIDTSLEPSQKLPRLVIYHQTHFHQGQYISLSPLLAQSTAVTHVILAAVHLNDQPGDITLNDDPPFSPKNAPLWTEVPLLQQAGIKVLGMIGGAAKGTFARLDCEADEDEPRFQAFYQPLREVILMSGWDGVDLDVEEEMSLSGAIRLIDALRTDFGPDFLITMAPIATAMCGGRNLSGFSYDELHEIFGENIAWYNVQFYCGHGNVADPGHYDALVAYGAMKRLWRPRDLVLGVSTNPSNAQGWVPDHLLGNTVATLASKYADHTTDDGRGCFGGVMCWEYWNSITSSEYMNATPDCWARLVTTMLRPHR